MVQLREFLTNLFANYYEAAAMILFGIGFTSLLMHRNLVKKIIGFNFMDSAIYLFLAAKGYITGRLAPIITGGNSDPQLYVNPTPTGLVLTGIVVSVSVTAFSLALTCRLYDKYHTLDIDEITYLARKERD